MDTNKKMMEMLNFDPMAEAEKMTGLPYKGNEEVTALGWALMAENNQNKREALIKEKDTHFAISFADFSNLVKKKGFDQVYEEIFNGNERLRLWANTEKGLLIVADSYGGDSLNSGTLYGQCRMREGVSRLSLRCTLGSTGRKDICTFDIDVREALFTQLHALEEEAETMPIWEEPDTFLWLLNYEEGNGENKDYLAVAQKKLSQTPQDVREMVRFSERKKSIH